jgi:Putative MetA-pathway of phenol degradation
MKIRPGLLCLAAFLAHPAFGQDAAPATPETPAAIQDDSFLVEEAYNQETDVVQHINEFTRSFDSKDWIYTFTQEWPVRGLHHQLSYTVPLQHAGSPGVGVGFGDVALNYRYQLVGSGKTRLAAAPRLSLLVPTGDSGRSYGTGAVGIQTSLPVSVVLGPRWVAHSNVGATLTPRAKDAAGDRATTVSWNLGQSLIWLARPRFNVLVETVYQNTESVVGPMTTARDESLLVSPGIRCAFNFESGLQIVPGLAVPIGIGPSRGDTSLLLYLSFEHPFRRLAR